MFENNQTNIFHCVPLLGKSAKTFNAVIEIEKDGKNKYEYDKNFGLFKLDRVLYGAVFYPTDYGFLPQTWSIEEQDPLDVMVICTNPTVTGCLVEVRLVGIFKMTDRDILDHKMIWENYAKLQPTKKIEVIGWGCAKEAEAKVLAAHEVYKTVYADTPSKPS